MFWSFSPFFLIFKYIFKNLIWIFNWIEFKLNRKKRVNNSENFNFHTVTSGGGGLHLAKFSRFFPIFKIFFFDLICIFKFIKSKKNRKKIVKIFLKIPFSYFNFRTWWTTLGAIFQIFSDFLNIFFRFKSPF